MKQIISILILIYLITNPLYSFCQQERGKARIATIARYKNAGIELRWIADNKTVLQSGFSNSYTVERADAGSENFTKIATVKTASRANWDSLIQNEKNAETKSNLELAADFLFADKKEQLRQLSLNEGIAELQEQKSKEDLSYAVFVLTAIKDGKVAEALGVAFIDKGVSEGKQYTYRVTLNAILAVYEIEAGKINIKAAVDTNRYKNEVFVTRTLDVVCAELPK